MKVIKYISIFGAILATAGFVACDDDDDDPDDPDDPDAKKKGGNKPPVPPKKAGE